MSDYNLPARVLNALTTNIAARKDVRYYLNGLHFYNDGAGQSYVEATDGHTLFRYLIDLPDGVNIIAKVPKLPVAAWCALDYLIGAGDDSYARVITDAGATFPLEIIDGRYPDTDRVFGALPDNDSAGVMDGHRVAEVVKVANEIAKSEKRRYAPLRFDPMTSGAVQVYPVQIDASTPELPFQALVMGMKVQS